MELFMCMQLSVFRKFLICKFLIGSHPSKGEIRSRNHTTIQTRLASLSLDGSSSVAWSFAFVSIIRHCSCFSYDSTSLNLNYRVKLPFLFNILVRFNNPEANIKCLSRNK